MRPFVLNFLFVVLVISLNQDETWALPRLSDQILTEADLEEIIDRGLPLPQIVEVPVYNCDSPTDRPTLGVPLQDGAGPLDNGHLSVRSSGDLYT